MDEENIETIDDVIKSMSIKNANVIQYTPITLPTTVSPTVLGSPFIISKPAVIVIGNIFLLCAITAIATILSIGLTKVRYGQSCTVYSQCEPTENTYCTLNGSQSVCQCDSTNYWNGKLCYPKSTYNQTCTSSEKCRSEYNLECVNTTYSSSLSLTTYCTCNPYRYWDGTQCTMKKIFNYTCNTDNECADYLGLTCSSGKCDCLPTNTKFWNFTNCDTKRGYSEFCYSTYWCNTVTNNLMCEIQAINTNDKTTGTCTCLNTQWYDTTSKSCKSKYSYDTSCTSSSQCNDLVGLVCLTSVNKCRCPTTQYYATSSCVNKKSYNIWCASSTECDDNVGLSCQSNYCKCSSSTKFWSSSSSSCISLLGIGSACSSNNDCDYINKYLTCSSNICQCTSSEYYDLGYTNKCVTKLGYNQICSNSIQCDNSIYLYCQSNSRCGCNSDRYWSGSACVLRTAYGTSCSTSTTCYTYLTCRDNQCSCSSTTAYQSSTSSCANCPSGWFGYDNRCYQVYSTQTWSTARTSCSNLGSNYWLAQPSSIRELTMLNNYYIPTYGALWIGFYQPTYTCWSSYSGVYSSDSSYYKWCGGEPNCSGNSEHCTMLTGSSCYNDANCGSSFYYVCENDP